MHPNCRRSARSWKRSPPERSTARHTTRRTPNESARPSTESRVVPLSRVKRSTERGTHGTNPVRRRWNRRHVRGDDARQRRTRCHGARTRPHASTATRRGVGRLGPSRCQPVPHAALLPGQVPGGRRRRAAGTDRCDGGRRRIAVQRAGRHSRRGHRRVARWRRTLRDGHSPPTCR